MGNGGLELFSITCPLPDTGCSVISKPLLHPDKALKNQTFLPKDGTSLKAIIMTDGDAEFSMPNGAMFTVRHISGKDKLENRS